MEFRVINYFLTTVREGNISKASKALNVTQPTLSRQLKELERELNTKLFTRGNRKIELTEEGKLFYQRAQEILTLVERAQDEIQNKKNVSGDIYIGAGETQAVHHLGKIIKSIQIEYPEIRFHINSGDKEDLLDRLDNGLFDFCLILGDFNQDKYEYLNLPFADHWVLISSENLSEENEINKADLKKLPLIMSRQALTDSSTYLNLNIDNLNIVATYNLVSNAAILAQEGVGSVLTLDGLVKTEGTNLKSYKIKPDIETQMSIIWKKKTFKSEVVRIFMNQLIKYLNQKETH